MQRTSRSLRIPVLLPADPDAAHKITQLTARQEISVIEVIDQRMLADVVDRALQVRARSA